MASMHSKRIAAIEAKMPKPPPSEGVLYRSQWFANFLERRGLALDQLPKINGSIMMAMPLELAREMREEILEAVTLGGTD